MHDALIDEVLGQKMRLRTSSPTVYALVARRFEEWEEDLSRRDLKNAPHI